MKQTMKKQSTILDDVIDGIVIVAQAPFSLADGIFSLADGICSAVTEGPIGMGYHALKKNYPIAKRNTVKFVRKNALAVAASALIAGTMAGYQVKVHEPEIKQAAQEFVAGVNQGITESAKAVYNSIGASEEYEKGKKAALEFSKGFHDQLNRPYKDAIELMKKR